MNLLQVSFRTNNMRICQNAMARKTFQVSHNLIEFSKVDRKVTEKHSYKNLLKSGHDIKKNLEILDS